jgi:hypothetical protein
MVGLIWFVQIVHYPLFGAVSERDFAAYARDHQRQTTWVVGPVMLLELITAVSLLGRRPPGVSLSLVWAGLGLLAVIWLSTMFLQIPLHAKLASGRDPLAIQGLVRGNWIRTAAWTLRGLLALRMLPPS